MKTHSELCLDLSSLTTLSLSTTKKEGFTLNRKVSSLASSQYFLGYVEKAL